MHAWSMGRPRDPRLGTPPWPDAVARGKDAFLGAAVLLGLAAVAAGTEIDQPSPGSQEGEPFGEEPPGVWGSGRSFALGNSTSRTF